jgi:glyoxylate/hydroxypyruvate reductase A
MMMSVLLAMRDWDEAPWLERLRAALPDREIVTPWTIGDRAAVEYALSWRHPPGSLADLPNLKAIFSLGAGVDHMFDDPALPDVPVVRVVDADLRDRMSEWVMLHALIHLRQQRMYDWQQEQRIWEEDVEQPAAADVRVGVMGLGVMGAAAAHKLAAIGFDVAGWSRAPRSLEGVACFHGDDGLEAMLARTDILVALLPLTPDTRGILDARLFAKLARDGRLGGPILLNAGRGGLQVEADILAALDDSVLKAATLDVFDVEPLPQDSPLWLHPRVTISPHNAAISTPEAVVRSIVKQIEAIERGETLKNVVDRARGY